MLHLITFVGQGAAFSLNLKETNVWYHLMLTATVLKIKRPEL